VNGDVRLTRAQQAAAIGRSGENLALRSGAGCGKTLVLARRFTELLLRSRGRDDPLSRFVALTFTDKAALEMKQRLRRLLTTFATRAHSRSDREKLLSWVADLPEARISTIHSFCASLLRTHAIQAGIDPDFEVCADELLAARLRADAVRQAVGEAVEGGDEHAAELIVETSLEKLTEMVERLLTLRGECDLTAYADPSRTLALWRRQLDRQRSEAWAQLAEDPRPGELIRQLRDDRCSRPDDKLLPVRDELLDLAERIVTNPAARTPESFAALTEIKPGNYGSAKAWSAPVKEIRDRMKQLRDLLGEYAPYAESLGESDDQAARRLATMAALARRADQIYTGEKHTRGLLDFDDLLYHARELLEANESLRRRIAAGIDQLLMDECQDTSAIQVRILLCLLFGGGRAGGEEGKLFVVGDAKQSIYRFRGAQVEVFRRLCEQLGPSRQETLATSFRTHPAGAGFVNHLFAELMGEHYEPIRARRRQSPDGNSVEILIARDAEGGPVGDAEGATAAQASAVAQRIGRMLASGERIVWDDAAEQYRPVRPGDIAILFARMTYSLAYERELARWRVPYYVVAGTGFFQQQEVFDVLNVLRAIDNPFDDIAWFGALRSSLFGLDDEALMHIAEAVDPPYLPHLTDKLAAGETIGPLAPRHGQSLRLAVELLGRLGRQKDALAIDELIETVLAQTGHEATLRCSFQGRRRLGNVRRLVELARGAQASRLSLAEFVEQMSQRVVDQSRFEQAAVAGEGQDVVRLMTVHKAKGLEFPVVFVPDLNAEWRGVKETLLNRLDWGLTYKHQPAAEPDDEEGAEGRPPLSYRLARRREQADQQAEDIRKLYVAATRHKDYLALVAAEWKNSEGVFQRGDNPIRRIDEVLGINEALQSGREQIPYADGEFAATVRAIPSAPPRSARARRSTGERLLKHARTPDALADAIRKAAGRGSPPGLLGPIPPAVGHVEVAVTALSDFAYCPMLYRWVHELRVAPPAGTADRPGSPQDDARGGCDAATFGALVHRCMERLDFARPQPAEALVAQAAGELDLEDQLDRPAAVEQIEAMLARFRQTDLHAALQGAETVYRELDFVMKSEFARIRGQIDLLYQDDQGRWHVVDYKSDRIDAGDVTDHADRYRIQLLLYAAAAGRQLRAAPVDATVHFLRPGCSHSFPVDGDVIERARTDTFALCRELVEARRARNFARREDAGCRNCPYAAPCRVGTKGRT